MRARITRGTPSSLATRWAADERLTPDERAQLLELIAGQLRHGFLADRDTGMARRAETIETLAGALRTSLATRDRRRAEMDRALGKNPRGPRLVTPEPETLDWWKRLIQSFESGRTGRGGAA